LRRIDVHLIGLSLFVGGHIDVHVDILDSLRLESVASAVSEGARLHHIYGRHDTCVDCVDGVNVHRQALSGIGIHLVSGVVGSTSCFFGISVRSEGSESSL
jgi:hypothetical protein